MNRSKNCTHHEKEIFLNLVEQHKNVKCKKTKSKTTAEKNKVWNDLCTQFNAASSYMKRESKTLQNVWKNITA